jgi:hypothetical protein
MMSKILYCINSITNLILFLLGNRIAKLHIIFSSHLDRVTGCPELSMIFPFSPSESQDSISK